MDAILARGHRESGSGLAGDITRSQSLECGEQSRTSLSTSAPRAPATARGLGPVALPRRQLPHVARSGSRARQQLSDH